MAVVGPGAAAASAMYMRARLYAGPTRVSVVRVRDERPPTLCVSGLEGSPFIPSPSLSLSLSLCFYDALLVFIVTRSLSLAAAHVYTRTPRISFYGARVPIFFI